MRLVCPVNIKLIKNSKLGITVVQQVTFQHEVCLSVCLSAYVHGHILNHMSDITARNATARPLISLFGFLPFVFLLPTAGTSDGVITLLRILGASFAGTN